MFRYSLSRVLITRAALHCSTHSSQPQIALAKLDGQQIRTLRVKHASCTELWVCTVPNQSTMCSYSPNLRSHLDWYSPTLQGYCGPVYSNTQEEEEEIGTWRFWVKTFIASVLVQVKMFVIWWLPVHFMRKWKREWLSRDPSNQWTNHQQAATQSVFPEIVVFQMLRPTGPTDRP